MHPNNNYDYIIIGAGCSGLSLLMRMLENNSTKEKKILVIDKDSKKKNDRTWCFWEKGNGFFENIVHHTWDNINFFAPDTTLHQSISPYKYKMIRGIDFYNYCFETINKHSNISFLNAEVTTVIQNENTVIVSANEQNFTSTKVFTSVLFQNPEQGKNTIYLLQHFKGWIVETKRNIFDTNTATFMDFRVAQKEGTSFVYVLPTKPNQALIEYTLFTENVLEQQQYDNELHHYITNYLGITDYEIKEQEFGVIPMTNLNFPTKNDNIIFIGTSGGATKPSSGYTFQFIQKQCKKIITAINTNNFNKLKVHKKRFQFYDNVLLSLIAEKKLRGSDIFNRMFQKNKAQKNLKFLDNETSLLEEINIFRTLQIRKFFVASLRVVRNIFN